MLPLSLGLCPWFQFEKDRGPILGYSGWVVLGPQCREGESEFWQALSLGLSTA